jgi:hypothetical protein
MVRKFVLTLLLVCQSLAAVAAPIGNPIVSSQSSAVEGSHVFKSSAGLLNGFDATSGGTAGYLLILDSATVPADGPVAPRFCFALPATQTTGASWLSYPVNFNNGIVVVFSSTGCFTKTISSTAFFSAQVQ